MKKLRRWLSNAIHAIAARVSPEPYDPPRTAEDAARHMVAEAYQVVGALAFALDETNPEWHPTDAEIERALNYFSDGVYRDDFLPWPRETVE